MKNYKKYFEGYFPLFLFSFLSLVGYRANSQELPHNSDIGDLYYSNFNYERASVEYEKLASKRNPKPIITRRLVDCYDHLRNYPKFLEWAKRATELSSAGPNDYFYLGEALQESGQYDAAREAFQKARGTKLTDGETLENYIKSCEWATSPSSRKEWFTVENLSPLNTPFSEFSPILSGDSLQFVSDRPVDENAGLYFKYGIIDHIAPNTAGKSYLKMFSVPIKSIINLSGANDGNVITIHAFNPILSSGYHFGPIVFSRDGNRIYFTKTEKNKKSDSLRHLKITKADSSRYFRTSEPIVNSKKSFSVKKLAFINRFDLWYSDKVGNNWSDPKPFPYNGGVIFSVGHPAISNDGKYLYFSSDMPGGKGGFDLYVSKVNGDGSFSKPQNLSEINTAGDDEFPSIGEDDHLYFSSNGRLGYGGLDIYQATGSGDHWNMITNLGRPINSDKDDFSYSNSEMAGVKGFFASNRDGGEGGDDIYISKRISNLQILVKNNHFLAPISSVNLSIRIEEGKENRALTDPNGLAEVRLESGQKCTILAHKEGFLDTNFVFMANPQQLKNDTLTIFMDSVKVKTHQNTEIGDAIFASGSTVKDNYTVYYDLNKFNLREDALKVLIGLAKDLKSKIRYKILVSSFCDVRGSSAYNYQLSKKRSEATMSKLIALGIPKDNIQISWFGNQNIVKDCKKDKDCIEAEYIRNRRSDIKVVVL